MNKAYSIVYSSPSPATMPAYSPCISVLPVGRLLASMDRGTAVDEIKKKPGLVFTSDDQGKTWQQQAEFPLVHARHLVVDTGVYIIGHLGDLGILRSIDNGNTWSETVKLTEGQQWHGAPTNVLHANGRVYLVMEKEHQCADADKNWPVGWHAPVVLSAPVDADLLDPEVWTFSNDDLVFHDSFPKADAVGMPFFPEGYLTPGRDKNVRYNAPAGWLEGNIAQIHDPSHVWFDPSGKTFQILLRCHAGGFPNTACLLKAKHKADGSIKVSWQLAPSGATCAFVSIPGGHLKFHILYDEQASRYFMASNISNDSMTRPEMLEDGRYNLPNDERRYLAVYVSRNLIDWQQLDVVAWGGQPTESRNYPAMAISGDDLLILIRSGDGKSVSAHNSNLITFHRIRNYRDLLQPWH